MTTITKFQSEMPAGRRRMLEIGTHTAAAITEIQQRGLSAALELVDTMGGVSQRVGLARAVLKACEKAGAVPAKKIIDHKYNSKFGSGTQRCVMIPRVGWVWRGDRQVAIFEFWPAWCVNVPAHKIAA
jgi:hypothetical protein